MTFAHPPRPQRRRLLLGAASTALAALAACSKTEAPPTASVAATPPAALPASGDAGRVAFDTASRGSGFIVGQAMAARQLRVFFDPQCPHCAALWVASKPLRDRVRMVWMPVAFLNPNSGAQGALLLAAADGTATMDRHESLLASGQGGLPVAGPADAEQLNKVKANTSLLQGMGADSVPYIVWRAGADGPFGVENGVLRTEQLAGLLKL